MNYTNHTLRLCVIIFVFCCFILVPSFSQQLDRPWWYKLEEGKRLYRSGDYGNALITFEDARRSRLEQFTRMEQDFILLLSNPDVRPLGDLLEFVERYVAERRETAAAAALAALYHHIPRASLNGSVKKALFELDRLKAYPEAEYWLGETYRAEGELAMALRQYERALQNRALLEIPEFDIEIYYKIADIYRIRQNYQEMEKQTLEIVEGRKATGELRDNLWMGNAGGRSSPNQIRVAMARILENEGINRFLTLYRHNYTGTEKAHRLLGFYYGSTSRYQLAAEHLMFAFLIQNTVLVNEVIRREFDYTFSTLEDLMVFIRSRSELNAFLDDTEYYKTAYYLSSALYASGKTRPARELWTFLANSYDSGEWGNRARRSATPYIERPLEMP